MKHLFLNKELSVLAKEKGFNEPCMGFYEVIVNNTHTINDRQFSAYSDASTPVEEEEDYCFYICRSDVSSCFENKNYYVPAPLYQQITDWFREKHNIEVEATCIRFSSPRLKGYQYVIISDNYQTFKQCGDFDNKKDALDKGIEEAFKLI